MSGGIPIDIQILILFLTVVCLVSANGNGYPVVSGRPPLNPGKQQAASPTTNNLNAGGITAGVVAGAVVIVLIIVGAIIFLKRM